MATLSPEKTHPVVGKDELIHQIAARSGMTLKDTSKVIDAFTEVVREEIAQNHEVRLMGFGTWNLRTVAERRVKSIRGGKQITIPAGKRVGFTVGAVLSQAAGDLNAARKTTPSKTMPASPRTLQNGLKKR
jgi:DNA-binding protein HU-beta